MSSAAAFAGLSVHCLEHEYGTFISAVLTELLALCNNSFVIVWRMGR